MNTIGFDMDNDGMFPRLRCVGCGRVIELAKTGIDKDAKVIWNKQGEIAFAHQMCDDESYQYWEPIECFFRKLLHNTRLTPKKLNEKDPFDELFGVPRKSRKAVTK